MVRYLRRNLPWILLSLLLSLTMWVIVTRQENPEETNSISGIPVDVVGVPADLVLRNRPAAVVVWASATRQRWTRLGAENFRATVDASRALVGVQELPVRVTSIDTGVHVVSVTPVRVSIGLERIATKEVRVQIRVLDSAPFGFRADVPVPSPERVRVSGPESAVEQVVSVVAPLRLESAHSKVSEWIRPIPQGVDGRELKDLTVSPETVLVEVAIEQELAYRSVPVVAQLGGSPGLGYQILGVTVEPNTLTVVGEPTAIGQLRFLNIKPIELNRTTKDLTVIGEPLLPEGVSLARNQPVTVKVAVGAVAGSQTFSAVPTLLGLAPELESTMEPNVIQVVLSGPMPVLGLLNPRDIQVNLKVEGLPSGVHLLKPDIVVPSSIAVERTTPQQITVTLRPIPPATPTAMPVPQ